ncbi:He_Pig domain protein [Blastocystis sp. ATCC 50177/Nand II]|uniref:He_Pig domain protein n=1 Tax=Blastocystis sp. subtype 1 (strain ATCC 50177 / NandII) TaxID=478820 RepID=A0A196SLD7_BLAHN|nr:He_Pig domain protein [Blastocystis sp. ATCC 50177/Nand II]
MNYLSLIAILVSVAMSTITCENGQVYVAVTKKSTSYASEESYKILSGSQELVTSQRFANNEQRTDEYCLTASTNNQYTFRMKDTYQSSGDSWMSGAWASVAGIYGNIVFKGFMIERVEEDFTISLYYPIMKTQEWKTFASTSSIASDWTSLNFGDSNWASATMGSAPAMTGTQYFRKTFTGIADMAAYEYRFNYQYGIIAYVNGVEIYRDHMPTGAVTPSTISSGSFNAYEYHGVIRSAGEVTVGNNVLAVELHFPSSGENAVEFDAFVAALASSNPITETDKCYVYPYPTTVTGTATYPARVIDWYKGDAATATAVPKTLIYELSGPLAVINGLRVWPSGSPTSAPGSFTLEASTGASTWSTVMEKSSQTYTSNKYKNFFSYFLYEAHNSYRMTITAIAGSSSLSIFELQPVVCNVLNPTSMTFEPSSYTYYAYYQNVDIHPTLAELSHCSIQPALPNGLTLDANTCTVTGKAMVTLPSTTFTMTSTMGTASIQGTFTLQVSECTGSFVEFLRTYKGSAIYETFSVKDMSNQQVVLSVAASSSQTSNQDWSAMLCLSSPRYMIDFDSSRYNYWMANSYLYVNSVLLGDEHETIARIRFDADLGLPADRVINAQWSVAPRSTWEYKMGEVPANWQTASGWTTASFGSFPASSNQIQLYKQTFTVASLEGVSGFVISLRYLYGCVVYMNGVEVFRNGVNGDLSASSVGLNAYTNLLYHQISLPVKTMGVSETASVNYLQQGSNTIAVAIVAQTASQTSSVFDCAVRLVGASSASRNFDYTITSTGIQGSPTRVADLFNNWNMYSSTCTANNWNIAFDNDRREWISSITVYLYAEMTTGYPTQFVVKARNNNLEEWATLKTVTGMTWSLVGEKKKIWLENNKPYNQYRLENIATGSETQCEWEMGSIDLAMDSMPATVPELSYSTPIVINKDVEMGEIYANSDYFYDFTVTPALPAGIVIDSMTGKISGTATAEMPATTYQITAKKVGGGSSTASVTISVEICTGTKGLITLVVQMDGWPYEGSYKVYQGKGTSGQVVQSNNGFKVPNGLNYGDFCLPYGIYTVELADSLKDGWNNPAGYYLTVDLGAMIIDLGQMPPRSFSSLIPFQINYSDWKVYNSETAVAANWNALDFDDAAWMTVKAANMGNHMTTTVYARHEVQMPSLEDYAVLNVRVKYTGGLTVYFNGNKVARFNLAEEFEAGTEAQTVHDASVFSKFHVILSTVGAVAGKNVIAFEIHRAGGESAIVFDATGVFGVNECSPVQDTYAAVDATTVSGCTRYELLDLNPTIYGSLANEVGAYLAWTVENLEGSKFNSFALQTNVVSSSEDGEEYTTALEVVGAYTRERQRTAWDMPVGIAGFKQFRYEVDALASTAPSINAVVMQYCKPASSGSCPAVGEYPSVGEGQISPSTCPEGFRGYSYRECVNGQLGDVKNDKCEYKLPARLQYDNTNMEFVLNTQVSSGLPTYRNIVEEFYMQDSTPLPAGLSINPTTGEITGMPTTVLTSQGYTVRARNAKGETFVAINIGVRKGECAPEGVFDRTVVGETAVYQCALQGSYVGTQKRACVLGAKDGEWQRATGFCMPVMVIVLIVVVVIVIIAVVVFLIVRGTRSAKATGGVKGKAAKKTVKKVEPKKTKAVKV